MGKPTKQNKEYATYERDACTYENILHNMFVARMEIVGNVEFEEESIVACRHLYFSVASLKKMSPLLS